MKKTLLFLCCLPLPIFAGVSDMDVMQLFQSYIQPTPTLELKQNGISVQYISNENNLTDKIVYQTRSKKWSTKGPWSLASESMRNKVKNCKKQNPGLTASGCGWYDYKIIRLSPSGRYIELAGSGWEKAIWRMLDTKTGKLILSNDNGVAKSMWTEDRQQFIWQTHSCSIGGCSDERGTFITEYGNFPKYNQVNSDTIE